MTTNPKRAGILLAVLALGMSIIFILPKALGHQPLGVVEMKAMPDDVGDWVGNNMPVSDKEKTVLGVGTEFARKQYITFGSFAGKRQKLSSRETGIMLSVVLSGQDMNTSIHRPERCLPSQGWNIASTSEVPINIPGKGTFNATRLYNTKLTKDPKTGQLVNYRIINYYWFVGHTDITGSHFWRTFIDMKDRLLSGYNQRWAYIALSANVRQEADSAKQADVDLTVDEMMREFITAFMPSAVKNTVNLK